MTPRAPGGGRGYLAFYWPLALTSLVGQLESLCQNRVLAAAGKIEISTYANAHSAYMMISAFLAFIPQLVTMYARGPEDRRTCLRFVALCGVGLSLPLGLVAYSPLGAWTLRVFQGVPDDLIGPVRGYLAWLAPIVFFVTIQQYITGRLVQAGRTRAIIAFNVLHMAVLVALLLGLADTGLEVRWVLAAATIAANAAHVAAAAGYLRRLGRAADVVDRSAEAEGASLADASTRRNEPGTMLAEADEIVEGEAARPAPSSLRRVDFAALWAFYWPMAMTGLMFALSRPLIYFFANRLPEEAMLRTVAALRVAFDTGMFFQAPVNQFRHVYAQFGRADPRGVRRFMLTVTACYVGVMALVAVTPAGTWLFVEFLKLEPDMVAPVRQSFLVMCLGPAMISIRNVFHGELIVRERTRGMAGGGLFRIGAVFGLSAALYALGWLNHGTGAAIMVAGFGFEALGACLATRRLVREAAAPARAADPDRPA